MNPPELADDGPAISLFQQNMALLPALPNGDSLYRGGERGLALARLAAFLAEHQPTIAGLSEMWLVEERQKLRQELAQLYPYWLEGPGTAAGPILDGGLLLLSKMPVLTQQTTVYPHCLGEDCYSQKGALHLRVELPGEAAGLDLFLSHLQNPTPMLESPALGYGFSGLDKVLAQLDHLAEFIRIHREPGWPAVLLGDLNTDGFDERLYSDLLKRLDQPLDLWLAKPEGALVERNGLLAASPALDGSTYTANGHFAQTSPGQSAYTIGQPTDPTEPGRRLDYFLAYQGDRHQIECQVTRVIHLESSPGWDISDHYGLWTEIVAVRQKVD